MTRGGEGQGRAKDGKEEGAGGGRRKDPPSSQAQTHLRDIQKITTDIFLHLTVATAHCSGIDCKFHHLQRHTCDVPFDASQGTALRWSCLNHVSNAE